MSASSPPAAPKPKRLSRRWRWIVGLVGFLLVLFLLPGLPPVQRWIVRKIVERQVGWRVRMVEFGVGPTGLEASGIVFTMPGLEARTEPVAIRVAPLRLLTRQRLAIERIEARKLRLIVTPEKFSSPPTSAASAARAPFGGVLRTLRMPVAWTLDSAQVDGEIDVRRGAASMAVGAFAVQGGGFAGGHVGEFTYEVTVNSAILPPGPENKVRTHGTVRLTPDAAGGVARIAVNGELDLPHYGALALPAGKYSVEIAERATGEAYHAQVDFGPGGVVDLAAQFDAPHSKVTGRINLHLDQSLAASLRPEGLPQAALQGVADFTCDLRTNDATVALSGDLAAGDWAKLAPQLAAIGALKGRIVAALAAHAGQWSVEKLVLDLAGQDSPVTLHAGLVAPQTLPLPVGQPLVRLGFAHVPVAWANPWLVPSGRQLTAAEFSGEWTVARTDAPGVRLEPARPWEISAVAVQGPGVPALPPVSFAFSPHVEFSANRLAVNVPDFLATTARGDRLEASAEFAADVAAHTFQTKGTIGGTAATLFSEPDRPRRLALGGRWDLAHTGAQWRLAALELSLREGEAEPCLALQLLQPLTVDAEKWTVAADTQERQWVKLKFHGFPLGWVSRWTPGRRFAGTLAEGESVLRSMKSGKLGFIATVPWRLADVSYTVGGRTLFEGEASFKPGLAADRQAGSFRLNGLDARDRQGNRVTGSVVFDGNLKEKRASTTIGFDLDLPALPHSAETFGALHGTLRMKSHTETPTIANVETFSLKLRNDQRDLLALEAPQPFLLGLSDSGFVTAATTAPLRLTTGEIPLAWLKPWTGIFSVEGKLHPSEFALTVQMTKFLLRPVQPLHVSEFVLRRRNREFASDAELTLYPGLDLTLACQPLPKFQLGYTGTLQVSDTTLAVGGVPAVDLDAAIGFIGDEKRALPGSVTLTARLDFAALSKIRALAYRGCPPGGTLVTRIDGDVFGDHPLEWWARLEGVPSADGKRTLPACELSAHGHVTLPDNIFEAGVELRLDTKPIATDVTFAASLRLDGSEVKTGSTLRSRFFDAAEALALAQAFLPKRSAAAVARAKAREAQAAAAAPAPALDADGKPVYPRGEGPLWGGLRGFFDLELGAVEFAPYRIEHLRGRLDVDDRALTLSELSGEMFSGRWSGNAHIAYDPKNPVADHALAAEFQIEQFDSAKVVQAVFPNEKAMLGARIDLHAGMYSRGNAPIELIDRAAADFRLEGSHGVMRLRVPNQDSLATAALFGGTFLLSPELRAVGRLLRQFDEMPVDRVLIVGERKTDGEIDLREFRVDSPQVQLMANGRIPAGEQPLLQRPLELSVDLGAKDDVAIILHGMKLIEPTAGAGGYRALKDKFALGGKVGAPDTQPLYDLLARAVVGSEGTWGMLMRKVQTQIEKAKTPVPAKETKKP